MPSFFLKIFSGLLIDTLFSEKCDKIIRYDIQGGFQDVRISQAAGKRVYYICK